MTPITTIADRITDLIRRCPNELTASTVLANIECEVLKLRALAAAMDAAEPVEYRVGNDYQRQDGTWARLIKLNNPNTHYETIVDTEGCNYYTRDGDRGRVTGSKHDYSDPRNLMRLYIAPALAAPEPQKEGAAAWDTERHHALREAYCIGISDDYFKARPDDDAAITRMAFEAGFSRGFDAAVRRKDAEMLYAAAPLAPEPQKEVGALADTLCRQLQQKCVDMGVYWRAPDEHGVHLNVHQAIELLRDALGVEVEIAAAPPVAEPTEEMVIAGFESDAWDALRTKVMERTKDGCWVYSCREAAECVRGIYLAMRAAAPPLSAPVATGEALTCRCGLTMSANPHPHAGKPDTLLDVGAVWVCIPCQQKALHGWSAIALEKRRWDRWLDREGWSFLRNVIDQGRCIELDNQAGAYPSYEHLSARMDQAARERHDQLQAALAARKGETGEL